MTATPPGGAAAATGRSGTGKGASLTGPPARTRTATGAPPSASCPAAPPPSAGERTRGRRRGRPGRTRTGTGEPASAATRGRPPAVTAPSAASGGQSRQPGGRRWRLTAGRGGDLRRQGRKQAQLPAPSAPACSSSPAPAMRRRQQHPWRRARQLCLGLPSRWLCGMCPMPRSPPPPLAPSPHCRRGRAPRASALACSWRPGRRPMRRLQPAPAPGRPACLGRLAPGRLLCRRRARTPGWRT